MAREIETPGMDYMSDPVKTSSGLDLIAGIWLVLAPTILNYMDQVARTNDMWLGVAIAVVSFIRLINPGRTMWLGWINVVLGLWLIIAPFALGYVNSAPIWNDIILGIIVAVSSLWGIGAIPGAPRHRVSV